MSLDELQPRRCDAAEAAWLGHVTAHYAATAFGDGQSRSEKLRAHGFLCTELRSYEVDDPEGFLRQVRDRRRFEGTELAWLCHAVEHYLRTAFGEIGDARAAMHMRDRVVDELRRYGVEAPEQFLQALRARKI